MRVFLKIFFWTVVLPSFLAARGKEIYTPIEMGPLVFETPWLTGPLLTPSTRTIPKGHINIQPYTFLSSVYGRYNDNWQFQSTSRAFTETFETYIMYGLTDWLDVALMGQFQNRVFQGKGYIGMGDSLFGFDAQLLIDKPKGWQPSLKLILMESFPTGSFDNLDPNLFGADAIGDGTYTSRFVLVFGKLFHTANGMWINTRCSFAYYYFFPIDVHNVNAYGGEPGLFGQVLRHGAFPISLGVEWSISKNFAIACDLLSQFYGKVTFTRDYERSLPSTTQEPSLPSSYLLSLSPAVEWNFSTNLGIIVGAWFSILGKNSDAFASGVISVNIYL